MSCGQQRCREGASVRWTVRLVGRVLEVRLGDGGGDVVGAEQHESARAEPVAERRQTQLVVVLVLSVDDQRVDVDAGVQHGQLAAGRKLPQAHRAVGRTARHQPRARRDARTQHLHRNQSADAVVL